jgi:PAS domain S-box-containing protein
MDFSIKTAALSAAFSMGLATISFYYLGRLITETPALKWWALSFGAITIDYLMVFFLPFDSIGILIPLWEAVHATFVSGLLIGVLYFLNRKPSFLLIGILYTIIVIWGVFSVIAEPDFFTQTIPATLIASGMILYSGWILFNYQPAYGEPGYRFAGVAFMFWGLNRLDFSFVEFIPWFTPFGYMIAQTTALAMGIGLIISVLERQRHRAIISEVEIKKTTQRTKEELEQLVNKRTIELQQEIVERKQVEDELRGSEERLQAIFEANPDPVVVYDTKGYPQYLNPAFTDVFGWTLDELREKHVSFVPEDQKKITVSKIDEIYNSGNPGKIQTVRLTKQGNKLDSIMSAATIKGPERKPIGLVVNITDISEQTKLEIRLQQAQKMEAIGTLAGGIAHDFNNILSPIIGHTEMLLEDIPQDNPLRNNIEEIYTGTLRARDLVKQILTFSRQDKTEIKLIKIQPLIKEALKLIRSTIPTSIEIKQDVRKDCGIIKADPTQIHQVVMNLATNAYHAMDETGGELKVGLKEVELGEQDVINQEIEPGIYVCLTVVDTGVGMEKELTEKIFNPFFTTKEGGKGTGMGLSVVHGIVKNAGGSIHVYSEPGKGTEFNVYLPVVKNASKQQAIQAADTIQSGTERILLIDDDEAIVTIEKQLLERLGYQVVSRTISLEALEAFRDAPDKFDMVITDMDMPNMSGDKLASELVKIRPDIPILLCTGFSERMSEEKAVAMGIRKFLMKPITIKDLSKMIREVLDKRQEK